MDFYFLILIGYMDFYFLILIGYMDSYFLILTGYMDFYFLILIGSPYSRLPASKETVHIAGYRLQRKQSI
jgi:hypothetical protein